MQNIQYQPETESGKLQPLQLELSHGSKPRWFSSTDKALYQVLRISLKQDLLETQAANFNVQEKDKLILGLDESKVAQRQSSDQHPWNHWHYIYVCLPAQLLFSQRVFAIATHKTTLNSKVNTQDSLAVEGEAFLTKFFEIIWQYSFFNIPTKNYFSVQSPV